jgi:hypothetical protein
MMRNRSTALLLLVLVCLLASCTGATSEFVSSLFDGDKWEVLEGKALQYMIDNYGDHFELSPRGHYTSGSTESIDRHIYVLDTEHPYDDIDVVSPGSDDGKGEVFATNYPYYLFGNDAGPEWTRLVEDHISEGAYLPRIWKWSDKEEDGGKTIGQLLIGLTKDSTLQDFIEIAPIEGVLMVPVEGDRVYSNAQKYAALEKMLEGLGAIDDKHDISVSVIFVKKTAYDELATDGNPINELAKRHYSAGAEWLQLFPVEARNLYSYDDDVIAAMDYIKEDGEPVLDPRWWQGVEEPDYVAE